MFFKNASLLLVLLSLFLSLESISSTIVGTPRTRVIFDSARQTPSARLYDDVATLLLNKKGAFLATPLVSLSSILVYQFLKKAPPPLPSNKEEELRLAFNHGLNNRKCKCDWSEPFTMPKFSNSSQHSHYRMRVVPSSPPPLAPTPFLKSIKNPNYTTFAPNSKGSRAKNHPQFFFFTSDGEYLVKTIKARESVVLKNMLPKYCDHVRENPNSLINRIFAVYEVEEILEDEDSNCYSLGITATTPGRRPPSTNKKERHILHTFVVLKSVLPSTFEKSNEIFDLKGSTDPGRKTGRDSNSVPLGVMKDLDFICVANKNAVVTSKSNSLSNITETIRIDAKFLASIGVMDYSLLVGVEPKRKRGLNRRPNDRRSCKKESESKFSIIDGIFDGEECNFHCGIIDYLQPWSNRKRTEREFKRLGSFGLGAGKISCMEPKSYSERFVMFVNNQLF